MHNYDYTQSNSVIKKLGQLGYKVLVNSSALLFSALITTIQYTYIMYALERAVFRHLAGITE